MFLRFMLILVCVFQLVFAHAGIVVVNGLTHNFQVAHGKSYKGKVQIENTGNTTETVKIYLQDFSYKADGTTTYSALNTNKRTNSNWITLNTNLLTLKPKEKTEIFFEITVPELNNTTGSFWSVLLVEPVEEIKPNNDKSGVSVTSIIRYAVQIITDLQSSDATPQLMFEAVNLVKEDNRKVVKVAVVNTGNLFSKNIVAVELYSRESGEKIGSYSSVRLGLLPEMSKTFSIDITDVVPGNFNATILATDEQDNAFAINVELEVKND